MKGLFLLLMFLCLEYSAQVETQLHSISGYVIEKGSKEHLPGAVVSAPEFSAHVITNSYGYYSLSLRADCVTVLVHYTGFAHLKKRVHLRETQVLNFELEAVQLEEVEIKSEMQQKVSEDVQMSSISLPVEQIKQVPTLLGEKDVLKVIQLLPGVQKGSEGNAGVYVRG